MSTALVTGITGQDGSLLAELLVAEGHEVVGLSQDTTDPTEVPNLAAVAGDVRLVRGDLLDPGSLRRAVAEVAPDELFHLAAPTFVPASWQDPVGTLAAIASATAIVLDAAHGLGRGTRVVVAASSEVFGDAGETPQRETTPMRPVSPYGVAKLAALHLVRVHRVQRGLHAGAAIAFNHESERRPERFLPRKVTRGAAAIALGLEDELVLGDLDAVRDWSAARDVVRGMRLMSAAPEADDFVLASGEARTVGDLVRVAFGAAGVAPEGHVRVDPELVRPPEATPPLGDPTRARERLGWTPTTSFEELIGGMVAVDLERLRSSAAPST